MRIIKESRIDDFAEEYIDAKDWLMSFAAITRISEWQSIRDVRLRYPHADAVSVESGKTVTVFNVKGNRYRLVMALHYNTGIAYVLMFMPHAEYSKGHWKKLL